MIQYDVDWLMEERKIRDILAKADVVDATSATTAGETLRRIFIPGKKLGFMPNPVDYSIESGHNHERRDLPFDLFYACGNEERPLGLRSRDDRQGGAGDDRSPHPRNSHPVAGRARRAQFRRRQVSARAEFAAIGLNLSRRNDIYLYTSDRLAHMAGNGLAVMLESANGYQEFLPEGEFVYFGDFDEMIEKLRRLIADPDYRQRVAAAGRRRYHDLFNEQAVARYLVDVAFDRLDPAAYPWPTLHAF